MFSPELVVSLFFFFSISFLQFCVSSYEGSRRDAERGVFGADNAVVGLLLEIFRCSTDFFHPVFLSNISLLWLPTFPKAELENMIFLFSFYLSFFFFPPTKDSCL